jgi:outer membrane protein
MKKVVVVGLASLTVTVGLAAQARAQDDTRWAVGAGAAVFSSPFKGADDIVVPVPYFSYEGERLSVTPFNGAYRIAGLDGVTVSAITMLRFQLTDPEDSPFLEGMKTRRATVEGGLAADVEAGPGLLRLEAQTDLLGKHGGGQVSLGYGLGFPGGRLVVTSRAALSGQSAELVDYY